MIKYIIGGCAVLTALHFGWKEFQEKVAIAEKQSKQSEPEDYDAEEEFKKLSKRNQMKFECLNTRKSLYEIDVLKDLKNTYDELNSGGYPSKCIEEFECMKDGYTLCSCDQIFDTDSMCKYCWKLNFDEFHLKKGVPLNEKIAYITKLQQQDMYISDFLGKEISYRKIFHDTYRFGTSVDNNLEEVVNTIITDIAFMPDEDTFPAIITTENGESFRIHVQNGDYYVKETDIISNIKINTHGPNYIRIKTYIENEDSGIRSKSGKYEQITTNKNIRDLYVQRQEGDRIIWSI